VNQAIDEGYDTGRIGKDLVPLSEGLVGRNRDGLLVFVAMCDDLEEEVCIAVVVGKIAKLVDDEASGPKVLSQAPLTCSSALLAGQVIKKLAGALAPSSMKRRVKRSSMSSRSTFFGQVQSKSAIGLKRPRRAYWIRRSRLRRCTSRS
jgi:hypothetical protein